MSEKQEFEKKLKYKYPNLYADIWKDPMQTCMAWGVETGIGWFELIEKMSEKLEPICKKYGCKMSQIKEKFGTLRVYMSHYPKEVEKEIDDIIDEAERESEKTCEECGKPGKLYTKGWCMVRCDDCKKEEEKRYK